MIVDVTPGMSLAEIIMRLRQAEGESVTIRILPDSALLLTANEFRALALAAEREQIAIAVETRDPLRRQLASLFGVPLVVSVDDEDVGEPETLESGGTPEQEVSEPLPPVPIRSNLGEQTGDERADPVETANEVTSARPARRERRHRGGGGKGRWILAAVLLIGVAASAVAAYWWFFGTATVRATLVSEPVPAQISFDAVANGGVADEGNGTAITAEPVAFDLSITLDAPATGSRTIGDRPATGTIVLRNPGEDAVSIEEGFTFVTFEGETFVFPAEVEVPPATPEGPAAEVTAVVAAATPGTSGNRDVGMLSGRLENGVYYSNRTTPIAGGEDRVLTVVSQEDLDALAAEAEQTLRTLAASTTLSGGMRVVPSTLASRNTSLDFNVEPGQEAERVTVSASVTFDALAFPTEELAPLAEEALHAAVPEGFVLDSAAIAIETPVEARQEDGVYSLIATVQGAMVPVMTDDMVEQVAGDLAGMSVEEARLYLDDREDFASHTMSFDPGWLPERMPNDAGRITVVVE
jgi:hypothetical protein